MSSETACLSSVSRRCARELGDDQRRAKITRYRSETTHQIFQRRRDDQDGSARQRELDGKLENFSLGADVQPTRRLIEKQKSWIGSPANGQAQPSADCLRYNVRTGRFGPEALMRKRSIML